MWCKWSIVQGGADGGMNQSSDKWSIVQGGADGGMNQSSDKCLVDQHGQDDLSARAVRPTDSAEPGFRFVI